MGWFVEEGGVVRWMCFIFVGRVSVCSRMCFIYVGRVSVCEGEKGRKVKGNPTRISRASNPSQSQVSLEALFLGVDRRVVGVCSRRDGIFCFCGSWEWVMGVV